MALNVVDWVIIGLSVVGGIGAAYKGFFDEVSKKLGIILGIWLGMVFTGQLVPLIQNGTGMGRLPAVLISYFALFIMIYILVAAVGTILGKLFQKLSLGFVDRMFGFVLGIAETAIVLSVFWLLLSSQSLIQLGSSFSDSWVITNILDKLITLGKGIIGA
ncbi:MAG: CvpA family protein [Sphaerochaetaceae bacterium]